MNFHLEIECPGSIQLLSYLNLLAEPLTMPPKSTQPPKNWPPRLPYLTSPLYPPNFPPETLTSLHFRPPSALEITAPRGPSPLVKITPILDPSHPACGQSGLFAASELKPGTLILRYLGEVHTSGRNDKHADSDYDLSLDRDLGVGIDAAKRGNEGRFVNDYRGVAMGPNAEFREVWDVGRGERGMGVFVLAEGRRGKGRGKGIRKGEEILVGYGRGFWGARRGVDEEGKGEVEEGNG
ncbi:hypothetical protein BJ875DRAFT_434648 [Amylocarpus encephaloides]|uniref:SET domain-containing protein n=1 Tax=Amylocarpus encephaloides TaxID=45428 RepID=A0A9P7Y7J8_9HELO|nr:hypothetical protein BJ875DRAFT_434648 [Amylocarpus encephaloides]